MRSAAAPYAQYMESPLASVCHIMSIVAAGGLAARDCPVNLRLGGFLSCPLSIAAPKLCRILAVYHPLKRPPVDSISVPYQFGNVHSRLLLA